MDVVKQLMQIPELANFRLVGGTALGLLLGHRISEDIDLFTEHEFDRKKIERALINQFGISHATNFSSTSLGFKCLIHGIKLDVVQWNIPFIHPPVVEEGIRMAHIEDIFAMKLEAVSDRATKKDYYDLAELFQNYSMKQALIFYKKRFPFNDAQTVLRLLCNFDQADPSPDPNTLRTWNWQQVKGIIQKTFDDYKSDLKKKKQIEIENRISRAEKLLEEKKKKKR